MLITTQLLYKILDLKDPIEWETEVIEKQLEQLCFQEIISLVFGNPNIHTKMVLERQTGKTTKILIEAISLESIGCKSLIISRDNFTSKFSTLMLNEYRRKIFIVLPRWEPKISIFSYRDYEQKIRGLEYNKVFMDLS